MWKMLEVVARKPYPDSKSLELTLPKALAEILDVRVGEIICWKLETRKGNLIATISKK